jgi:predicted nucleic acid-binding protein
MTADIRDMGNVHVPLPEMLVADTSLLLSLAHAMPRSQQRVASDFLTRLANAAIKGEALILVPLLVMEECYFKLLQVQYEAIYGRGIAKWHDEGYKKHPELIRNFMPMLEQFRDAVLTLPAFITGPDDLIQTADLQIDLERAMLDNVSSDMILPKDAYIVAEATRLGVNCLATMGSDWDRADGFIVYRPN